MAIGNGIVVKDLPHHPKVQGLVPTVTAVTWAQCYKTFYPGNLPPFHGGTVILCYKATLPW